MAAIHWCIVARGVTPQASLRVAWEHTNTIVPLASQGVQAWDRYAGMNNNPIRYNDPSGHDVGCAGQDASECAPLLPPGPPIRPTSTPTPTYRGRPTSKPTPGGFQYQPAQTATPTSIPPSPETTENDKKPFVTIEIDWSKVDKVDFVVDAYGVGLEFVAAGFAAISLEPLAATAEGAQVVVEGAGFVKSVVDVVNGDPQNLLMQQTTSTLQRVAVLFFRAERVLPVIGLIGNGVSLAVNLRPKITINP